MTIVTFCHEKDHSIVTTSCGQIHVMTDQFVSGMWLLLSIFQKKLDTSLMWMNKRSRKKSKPSALTRPPRRGRRKRLKVFHANMCLSGQPVISAVPSVSGKCVLSVLTAGCCCSWLRLCVAADVDVRSSFCLQHAMWRQVDDSGVTVHWY